MTNKNQTAAKRPKSRCETCEFFEEDDEGCSCVMNLDEDEFVDFLGRSTGNCPYYRFYDEYKSVQKQNRGRLFHSEDPRQRGEPSFEGGLPFFLWKDDHRFPLFFRLPSSLPFG